MLLVRKSGYKKAFRRNCKVKFVPCLFLGKVYSEMIYQFPGSWGWKNLPLTVSFWNYHLHVLWKKVSSGIMFQWHLMKTLILTLNCLVLPKAQLLLGFYIEVLLFLLIKTRRYCYCTLFKIISHSTFHRFLSFFLSFLYFFFFFLFFILQKLFSLC